MRENILHNFYSFHSFYSFYSFYTFHPLIMSQEDSIMSASIPKSTVSDLIQPRAILTADNLIKLPIDILNLFVDWMRESLMTVRREARERNSYNMEKVIFYSDIV